MKTTKYFGNGHYFNLLITFLFVQCEIEFEFDFTQSVDNVQYQWPVLAPARALIFGLISFM